MLEGLRAIAPVHAVRGNNDSDAWSGSLPLRLSLDIAGVHIHVLHDLNELRSEAQSGRRSETGTGGYRVVIAGHSHKPTVVERDGVLYVNPGSAGPRRFKLPVTIAYLTITQGSAAAEIRTLL